MYKMDVGEMRMLRGMCPKTRKNKIRNERFLKYLRVASIEDKIRETHLRCFWYVQRRLAKALVEVIGQRGGGWR